MNKPTNKETYILDDSIAFELMDLLKAKARHFIQLNEYVYRLLSWIKCLALAFNKSMSSKAIESSRI